jgi:hypothetical protein
MLRRLKSSSVIHTSSSLLKVPEHSRAAAPRQVGCVRAARSRAVRRDAIENREKIVRTVAAGYWLLRNADRRAATRPRLVNHGARHLCVFARGIRAHEAERPS